MCCSWTHYTEFMVKSILQDMWWTETSFCQSRYCWMISADLTSISDRLSHNNFTGHFKYHHFVTDCTLEWSAKQPSNFISFSNQLINSNCPINTLWRLRATWYLSSFSLIIVTKWIIFYENFKIPKYEMFINLESPLFSPETMGSWSKLISNRNETLFMRYLKINCHFE